MHAQSSPFRRRAQKRIRRAQARARAPRHPLGAESQLKIATDRIFRNWHAHLKQQALSLAPHRARLRRQDADTASDASTSVFHNVWNYALQLLHTSPFKRLVDQASQRTAKSAADQTREALKLGDEYKPNLDEQMRDLSTNVFESVEDKMRDSITRAADILDDFDPDEDDLDELGDDLDDGFAGILGGALSLVGLAFGYGFSKLVKGSQEAAGVGQYEWMAQRDSVVRPEHLQLDNGDQYDWGDPPLTEEESSSGEACHPGEDYNCRCVASPVPPDEGDEES